jgi:hypothetical protein
MTSTATSFDQRAVLEERFRLETSWREGTLDGVPSWFGTLLTDLVLAIGEDEIRYFSVNFSPKNEHLSGSLVVIVFTGELVAYASLDPEPELEHRQFEVIVTARRSLRSFSIETAPDYVPDSDGMQISVIYPDFSRTLPLGKSDWPHRHTDLSSLLSCLRLDLTASK